MIIKADKEGIQALTELVDVYLKATGVKGLRNAQIISASISELKEDLIPTAPVNANTTDMKVVQKLDKVPEEIKK